MNYDPHGGADCYGNADGTGGSAADMDAVTRDIKAPGYCIEDLALSPSIAIILACLGVGALACLAALVYVVWFAD